MKLRLLKPPKKTNNPTWMKGFILSPALSKEERLENEFKHLEYEQKLKRMKK